MSEPSGAGSSGYTTIIGDVLELLSRSGTWLDATERLAVASVARSESPSGELSTQALEAARRMAHNPTTINAEWIDQLESSGLSRPAMAEILAVVSRQVAIDTFMFGVGAELTALPLPSDGLPTKQIIEGAALNNGWLATVGPASPHTAFTSVPPEQDALGDLHAGFYLPMADIFDFTYERDGLSRPQMELVAARTSHLNECFY